MTKSSQLNASARDQALASLSGQSTHTTALIEYSSNGRVIVIGDELAMELAPRLREYDLKIEVLLTSGGVEPGEAVIPVGGRAVEITGYMGEFKLALGEQGTATYEELRSDLILDLSKEPLLKMAIKPPGYVVADSGDEFSLLEAFEQLKDLKGTFEKPRFFDYNPSICAHTKANRTGCTACLDACPAGAITSIADSIEVNPYLCQGGGVCATVCPTGAIRYVYPSLEDTLNRVKQVLQQYQIAGGEQATIGFISEEDFAKVAKWPDNVIPIILEELASVGLDVWLATLAYGASSILLLEAGSVHAGVETALKEQVKVIKSLLSGMSYSPDVIQYRSIDYLENIELTEMPEINAAKFAGSNRKREVMFFAINHLTAQARILVESLPEIIELPKSAPFGQIVVNSNKCTLCMGCTSVCPASALHAGNEVPRLSFIEENCVQCGLCETACPEQAIQLAPRMLTDRGQRCSTVTLNEENPFLCITCSKPFATQSLIDTILGKLSGHAMFQSERAKQRLMMCEDCRVVDVIQDTEAMQDQALRKKF